MASNNLQLYSNATIYVNGSLLGEAQSINVSRATNSQQIITIAKGYAGESPGAAMCEFSVDSAVPSQDFEMNPDKFMGENKSVEIVVYAAGSQLTIKGFIIADNFSYAANAESKLSFNGRGQFASWS